MYYLNYWAWVSILVVWFLKKWFRNSKNRFVDDCLSYVFLLFTVKHLTKNQIKRDRFKISVFICIGPRFRPVIFILKRSKYNCSQNLNVKCPLRTNEQLPPSSLRVSYGCFQRDSNQFTKLAYRFSPCHWISKYCVQVKRPDKNKTVYAHNELRCIWL